MKIQDETGITKGGDNPIERTVLVNILSEYGLTPSRLKKLVEKGVIGSPKKTGRKGEGRGTQSVYPPDSIDRLHEYLDNTQQQRTRRAYSSKKLHDHPYALARLPSPISNWDAYKMDRALLDILYARNVNELRSLLYGAQSMGLLPKGCRPSIVPKIAEMKRKYGLSKFVLYFSPFDRKHEHWILLLTSKKHEQIAYNERGCYLKDNSSIKVDPSYDQIDRSELNSLKEKYIEIYGIRIWGYRLVKQIDMRAKRVYLESKHYDNDNGEQKHEKRNRSRIHKEDLFQIVSGPLELPISSFLDCFGNDEELMAFQGRVEPALRDLIVALNNEGSNIKVKDLRNSLVKEMRNADYLSVTFDKNKNVKLPTMEDIDQELIKRPYLKKVMEEMEEMESEYPLRDIFTEQSLTADSMTYEAQFIPWFISPTVNAEIFVYGRLRHIWQSNPDKSVKPGEALASRFKYCPMCTKIFVRTNLKGEGVVRYCGICANSLKSTSS